MNDIRTNEQKVPVDVAAIRRLHEALAESVAARAALEAVIAAAPHDGSCGYYSMLRRVECVCWKSRVGGVA